MSDEPNESIVFKVGDQHLDAWGQEANPDDNSEGKDYSKMNGKQLKAEIDRRNEGRDADDLIVLEDNKKATAVAALEADDEASESDEEE